MMIIMANTLMTLITMTTATKTIVTKISNWKTKHQFNNDDGDDDDDNDDDHKNSTGKVKLASCYVTELMLISTALRN